MKSMKHQQNARVEFQKDQLTDIELKMEKALKKYPGSDKRKGNRKAKKLMQQIDEEEEEYDSEAEFDQYKIDEDRKVAGVSEEEEEEEDILTEEQLLKVQGERSREVKKLADELDEIMKSH